MQFLLDLSGELPLYQQIREQVIAAIARGDLHPGDPLPSVRQLAVDTGVNMHTVNKSYHLLKLDGYLTIDRRSGARVAPSLAPDPALLGRVREDLSSAAIQARSRRLNRDEFLALCEQAFDLSGQSFSSRNPKEGSHEPVLE